MKHKTCIVYEHTAELSNHNINMNEVKSEHVKYVNKFSYLTMFSILVVHILSVTVYSTSAISECNFMEFITILVQNMSHNYASSANRGKILFDTHEDHNSNKSMNSLHNMRCLHDKQDSAFHPEVYIVL